jgi:hypothetical protein
MQQTELLLTCPYSYSASPPLSRGYCYPRRVMLFVLGSGHALANLKRMQWTRRATARILVQF